MIHLNTIQMSLIVALIGSLLLFHSCRNRNDRDSKRNYVSGKVVSIIDGDTYDLLVSNNHLLRIRMEGIDAPERGMPFYKVSKRYLGQLCSNKKVSVKISGKDNYDRFLGFTCLDNMTELSHEMTVVIPDPFKSAIETWQTPPVLSEDIFFTQLS